ncbi:MAG: 2Fe-2S iron-sulfur cluster-binding protein [Bacteroidota bacterium]|nr:2Fe-2S iron-sulfur cluster-binding protein [Bacteroidota bacterium]
MITIHITDRDGCSHELEVPEDVGVNLMELCKASDLHVEGTCGGIALCGSCHIYVHSNHELSEKSEAELFMLDQLHSSQDNSRLSCQMPLKQNLDGLHISLAPEL